MGLRAQLRQTEIEDFDLPRVAALFPQNKDIRRLDIAVDDALGVRRPQRIADLIAK